MAKTSGPILITGVTGFIGEHLISRLNKLGIEYDVSQHSRPSGLVSKKSVVHKVDITDINSVKKLPSGYSKIVHLAGRTGGGFVDRPLEFYKANALGTLNLLEYARVKDIDGFIYASTAAVYGKTPRKEIAENQPPEPTNTYSISKHAGELYARVYRDTYGLNNITLRFFSLYGPPISPENSKGLVSIFCRNALRGVPLRIFERKTNMRDYVSVNDVVSSIIGSLGVGKLRVKDPTFNIGSGVGHSTEQLVRKIIKLTGKDDGSVSYELKDDFDVFLIASIEKAKRFLNYEPRYDLDTGIKEVISWMKNTNGFL
jgi:nucleoside-diphosphate-sugar epimerase